MFPHDDEQQRRVRNLRNIALVMIVIIFAVILLQSFFGSPDSAEKQIRYSEFLALLQAGQVTTVTLEGTSFVTVSGRVRPVSALAENPFIADLDARRSQEHQRKEKIEALQDHQSRRLAWIMALRSELPYPLLSTAQTIQRQLLGLAVRHAEVARALEALVQARKQKADEISALTQGILGRAERFRTKAALTDVLQELRQHKIDYDYKETGDSSWIFSVLLSLLPLLIIALLWYGMMRRMQGEGSSALNFGRSQAKLVTKEYSRVTFDDVAGIDEVKEEVQEIVDYLKDPQKFTRIGAQIPKGVLLVGPPGTGKTLLARAIAGEADVPFFSISGSDFVEMFVGVGAARVRDLFRRAKEEAKGKRGVIIFIDEIDAVGRKRGAGIGGGHDEREQTLNQLLSEMDGFEKNEHVIILAATNRPDILDPALLRPGRFDRKITVPPPDSKGREAILKVHTRNKKLAPDVDLKVLARRTPGFVGADLENLCNEAALLAARRNKEFIDMKDFEDAIDRVIAGIERKGRLLSEEEKVKIAYHEAGHALLGKLLPKADPVHRISIVPRGEALGYTLQLPLNDKYLFTKEELLDRITGILGGRAAEELIFNEISTGAYDDLKKATEIAKRMVVSYGMSERVGPINLGQENGNVFLGVDLVLNREHSEKMLSLADEEIKNIIESCYKRAKELLQRNLQALHKLARRLLEVEVLEGEQLDALLKDSLVLPAPTPA
ncbi:MAG: ATP-dependent zinc metalloprotease FtsH [Candidatus Bipolaricaulota bacterium]|nr:ATP-dependent zinc metalloprotease FtsH [Candidatus Bipolaricaulota bacterium]MDW8031164.1 ATP-dependent zinc metalloprotease FtsH [Candidatus Bipolaricaulota bacterium]